MNFVASSLPDLFRIIQTTITSGWISVSIDPSGQAREYFTSFADDSTLALEHECLGDKNEYTIYIDDDVIAHAVISVTSRIHTPDEEAILYLFSLCSSRVIAQEINMRVVNQGRKTYS